MPFLRLPFTSNTQFIACNTVSFHSHSFSMFCLTKRLQSLMPLCYQLRWAGTEAGQSRRRRHKSPALPLNKAEEKSEWWIVDGEMHEIGDNVPLRERFVIPRENIPNKRRKQLRDQFMRRTRLVLKESEHEPWCKKYMELYQELRENWERLYWDEGYSKKLAQDHANYESAEDDDEDFSPYRSRRPQMEHSKDYNFVRNGQGDTLGKDLNFGRNRQGDTWEKDQNFGRNRQDDTWEKARLIRDKFEYDRERRMREKAFAPMHGSNVTDYSYSSNQPLHGGTVSDYSNSRNQPLDADRYFSQTEGHS